MMNQTDIHSIAMPFPTSHMKWVNCFCLPGEGGWTLIDAGPNTEEARAVWLQSVQEIGFRFDQVKQIVLTHQHADHLGLAHWLQEQTGAPILISEKSYHCATQPHDLVVFEELLRSHQFSVEQTEAILAYIRIRNSWKREYDQVDILSPGSRVRLGDAIYDIYETGGHAEGHLCFHDPEQRRIFCGDQVMPKFIPNINLTPELEPNPMAGYLRGLETLRTLAVETAYSGHGTPFSEFHNRIAETHDIMLGKVSKFLHDLKAYPSLAELYQKKFGSRLGPAQAFFVVCEFIAYLRYLEGLGAIQATVTEGQIAYQVL